MNASSSGGWPLISIYREGRLSAAYSAAAMARSGMPADEIAAALKREAFSDNGRQAPAVNDNRVRVA